ncbi:MAG: phage tail protein [Robiginitomaculum sp.]|nr:phage tail protein [Robiginitomaculum sp.]
MLMQLGDFIFELATLAPDTLTRTVTANWPKQARYGGRPAAQFTGISGETVSVSGVIYPLSGITGTAKDLNIINEMITDGEDYVLAAADGYIKGVFAVLSVTESHTYLDKAGAAQKITFTINLERTDDDRIETIL